MSNPLISPESGQKISKLLRPLLVFAIVLLALQFFMEKKAAPSGEDIVLEGKNRIAIGKAFQLEVRNNSQEPVILPEFCPGHPLKVERFRNGEWSLLEAEADLSACEKMPKQIESGKSAMLSYAPWNWKLFGETGTYRISLALEEEGKAKEYSHSLEIEKPSIFRTVWQEGLYKPILNVLIFIIAKLPGASLGWAVILLTILIKLILLLPNQKALQAQKQMQRIQPQLDALKLKYKDNQQKLAQETMELWKKHKVSPMGSCLPMLIQLPVLIALFYVVRDGLQSINPDLLYGTLKGFDTSSINPHFAGMDLSRNNLIVLPLIVGGLQFIQMKLTLGKAKPNPDDQSPLPMMNQTMLYAMPVMIAFFTASTPAAVGIYWGTSTLFGLLQQLAINRSKN